MNNHLSSHHLVFYITKRIASSCYIPWNRNWENQRFGSLPNNFSFLASVIVLVALVHVLVGAPGPVSAPAPALILVL